MPSLVAIAASILPNFGVDVISVYTQDYIRVFADASPLKASIKEESVPMDHPLESGAETTDHRIILPVEIELSLILKANTYKQTYKLIKQLYLNATLLTVQTKTDTYDNQFILSMPHDETGDIINTIALTVKLKQVLFVTPQYAIAPKNMNQSTTIDKGNQQPVAATPEQTRKTSNLLKSGRAVKNQITGAVL